MIDPNTHCLLSKDKLTEVFMAAGLDFQKKTVFTCSNGVYSATGSLAWLICGGRQPLLYDGSWAEYVSKTIPVF